MSFEITPAGPGEWNRIVEWAAAEGWNPGSHDAEHFLTQDPEGFLLGRLDGEIISAISVINYAPDYAFLGFYLVCEERRGQGYGLATWNAGMEHAGNRIVGLDGVPDQQANYSRSGFAAAYTTVRYSGTPEAADGDDAVGIRTLRDEDHELLAELDARTSPADRHGFAIAWAADPRNTTVVRVRDGRLTAYGVLRPARESLRIGPLSAITTRDAAAVLAALLRAAGKEKVAVDIPEPHQAARNLAERHGLTVTSRTARMYTGPIREVEEALIYGVMSLELG